MKALHLSSLIFLLCVGFSVERSTELTETERIEWSKLNVRSLPTVYQQALYEIDGTPEGRDDFSSWCCKNGKPAQVKIVTKTFIRWEPTGVTKSVVVGRDSCGFGGWSSCTLYGIEHVPTSYVDYGHDVEPDLENSQCPDQHVVCCQSLVPVGNYCLTIAKFNRVVAEWTKLQSTNPEVTLSQLLLSFQNNGLPSSSA